MLETSRTAYLFQCEGEDLYAVSYDITGANIPRSPCTLGWRLCEAFELGRRLAVPAPIMPETILKGIADAGYYVLARLERRRVEASGAVASRRLPRLQCQRGSCWRAAQERLTWPFRLQHGRGIVLGLCGHLPAPAH
jgi:hypothetical protein